LKEEEAEIYAEQNNRGEGLVNNKELKPVVESRVGVQSKESNYGS
jgi:hypothetical protein